jgi:hypothetical protein
MYLLFDVSFVLLSIADYILPNYGFSHLFISNAYEPLISQLYNLPLYLTSLFWSIFLFYYIYTTKIFDLKQILRRIAFTLISYFIFFFFYVEFILKK